MGADGVLLVEPGNDDDVIIMRYFNANGHEAPFCGNGAMATAYYFYRKGLCSSPMTLKAGDGIHHVSFGEGGIVLRMSPAKGLSLGIPGSVLKSVASRHPTFINGQYQTGGLVDTGVPHAVLFVNDLSDLDVESLGRHIRYHPAFQPQGTNVDFVRPEGENKLSMRTYERGVEEETLACGTGVVAAAILYHRKMGGKSPLRVETLGGEYKVVFDKKLEQIELKGQVKYIFDGEIEWDHQGK